MEDNEQITDNQYISHADNDFCRKCVTFNYLIIVSVISILFFLHGFFPINYNEVTIASRNDIPSVIEDIRINSDNIYKPVIKRLIIMVIDALRYDFVDGPKSNETMPRTTYLLHKSKGCIYNTIVHPPTVTLPRVKAIATGTVPNFIDVVLNLGAPEIKSDSILRQSHDNGHKIIFYGDLTWPTLFPNMFYRHELTNTFFVSEYTEVDTNVTRNVMTELKNNDWSIMILHYSGLDHIGHLAGPYSTLIAPKLQEMDKVIDTIESSVQEWINKGEPTLFLVTGDHGMKNTGSHGGSTLEETLVPLLTFGHSCEIKERIDEKIFQIDLAPTLAVLLGIPIPSSSSGSVILNLLNELSMEQKLFALYYNTKHLFLHFKKISDGEDSDTYENYKKAIKLHATWLSTYTRSNEMAERIILLYESAIVKMKNTLTSNLFRYNIDTVTIAIIFMVHVLYISITIEKSIHISFKKLFIFFFGNYILWISLNSLLDPETRTSIFPQTLNSYFFFVNVPIFIIILLNSYLYATCFLSVNKVQTFLEQKLKNFMNLHILLPLVTFIHALFLMSSSFVEEEHQIWYYYFITVMLFFTYNTTHKSIKEKTIKLLLKLLIIIITHRILRIYNSTGNQHLNLFDLSYWLLHHKSNFWMTVILLVGLCLLIGLNHIYESKKTKLTVLFFNVFMATLVYLRHAATNAVFKPSFYFDSRGIIEVQIFWFIMLIYVIFNVNYLMKTMKISQDNFVLRLLFLVLKIWVIISCLLHRPHNVILLPIQLIVGIVIHELTKAKENSGLKVFLYVWSSNAFYFYQGNSNSLATVDLGAGYVGLESYIPLITGTFLVINTYSAPVLGFFMYLCDHAIQTRSLSKKTTIILCKDYVFWRLVPTAFYMFVMIVQRYHISIWTVFSPKILYEAAHCLVLFSVIFILELLFAIHYWAKNRGENLHDTKGFLLKTFSSNQCR